MKSLKPVMFGFLLAHSSFGFAESVHYNWTWTEKIESQAACQRAFADTRQFHACVIGNVVYADGRSWAEGPANLTKSVSKANCYSICESTGNYVNYCRAGCDLAVEQDN